MIAPNRRKRVVETSEPAIRPSTTPNCTACCKRGRERLTDLIRAAAGGGVFHPKVILQAGRKVGRLIVASANMTASGLAGNLEIAGLFTCAEADSPEQRLIAAAWRYVDRFLDRSQGAVDHQRDWMLARAAWLRHAAPAEGAVTLADGTLAELLPAGGSSGIGTRFTNLIDEPVERLIVVSPYWDDEVSALRSISRALGDPPIALLIDVANGLFPGHLLGQLPNAGAYNLGPFAKKRFAHAKLMIAQTASHDHVLFGSANCTSAAMGTATWAGSNDEASIYRRLPRNALVDALKIEQLLTTPVLSAAIAPQLLNDPLPLHELASVQAGAFETRFDTLVWRPTSPLAAAGAIELLGFNHMPFDGTLEELDTQAEGIRRFRITGTVDRPAFARVQFPDGRTSAPAVITHLDLLQEAVRERRSRPVEAAAQRLSEETEVGLWLMESLEQLEAAEAAQRAGKAAQARQLRSHETEVADETPGRTLPYEQFIAGRQMRDAPGMHSSSFAGSDLVLVSTYLNRALGLAGPAGAASGEEREQALKQSFLLGGEADAAGQSAAAPVGAPAVASLVAMSADEKRRRNAASRATRDQILLGVKRFTDRMASAGKEGLLTPTDVLRLRTILMIICAASSSRADIADSRDGLTETSLQVLPLHNEGNWPRLLGQALFVFFGGPSPPVRHLAIAEGFEDIPDDLITCWATCMYAIQLCRAVSRRHKAHAQLAKTFEGLSLRIYSLTGLRRSEMEAGPVVVTFDRMFDSFGARLGVTREDLLSGHVATLKELFRT